MGRSFVALDGRAGAFLAGDNGTLSAFNILTDLHAPGDAVASNR
ncbi:MAG: hypothetical protein ACRD1H_05875 [Vicinamibacterales bacterium]